MHILDRVKARKERFFTTNPTKGTKRELADTTLPEGPQLYFWGPSHKRKALRAEDSACSLFVPFVEFVVKNLCAALGRKNPSGFARYQALPWISASTRSGDLRLIRGQTPYFSFRASHFSASPGHSACVPSNSRKANPCGARPKTCASRSRSISRPVRIKFKACSTGTDLSCRA